MFAFPTFAAAVLHFLCCLAAQAQGTVPTFSYAAGGATYTLAGGDPANDAVTRIPTLLVPVTLVFDGKAARLDAGPDAARVLHSPIFAPYAFAPGARAQYADAMLRATFPQAAHFHTQLAHPAIKPLTVHVPVGSGYVLSSKRHGGVLGVVDMDYLQKQVFAAIGRQDGTLVLIVTHNATFYVDGDATICCATGTHGVDEATGTSFVLGSYMAGAPPVVTERDVQPLTEQLAEFVYDPLHDPQHYGYGVTAPGNAFPAWLRTDGVSGCGDTGVGSSYFLLDPVDTNPKNNIPAAPAFAARVVAATYHLQDVALLSWYLGGSGVLSFPDAGLLRTPAVPCAGIRGARAAAVAQAAPADAAAAPHALIGYWTGRGVDGQPFPLHDVSPQWDVVIVAFAAPARDEPEGTLRFRLPVGVDAAQFRQDVAALKQSGRKVMLSLGGGGAYFSLDDPAHIPDFVTSATDTVTAYGFDGVDIDFESPSLLLRPGDTDFRHPTTPSIVNLIAGLRQLREHFGPSFMISLVPEGPQLPAGAVTYGGQFGSYVPIVYALRDILSFVDVQDYNTPPLEGLDGEIYQSHTVGYHAALTELLLRGFPVGGYPRQMFPPLPASMVAVGFLTGYDTPELANAAMHYLLTGRPADGTPYRLKAMQGYPGLRGAMFWTIDDDMLSGDSYSNLLGPQLHAAGASR